MKIFIHIITIIVFLFGKIATADQLDLIKKSGVIRIAVFDSNPPFGFIDHKSQQLTGYDIDIAKAIADDFGVKLILRPTNPANRIPLLLSGKVDLIGANFTITNERAKQVEFSIPDFTTGQKFIARKGLLKTPNDIVKLRIGADKGTVQEVTLRKFYPNTTVISYDDTPLAFAALQNGNVHAITQDDAKLIGLFSKLPTRIKDKYEISPFSITHEYQGLAVSKGEKKLIEAINKCLLKLENNGQAEKIYNKWFGPGTLTELPRGNFKFMQLNNE